MKVKNTASVSNISVFKRVAWWLLGISAIVEMMMFPSLDNFVGIIVSVLSTMLFFKHVLRIEVIRRFPICFIVFFQLFAFMYLPLPATLADGVSMSHDLYNPILAYTLQFFYFCITLLAFQTACRLFRSHKGLQRILLRHGYFSTPTSLQLWLLGFIGWIFRLYMLNHQYAGSGDELYQEGFGTLNVFAIFVYAPILILFKPLLGGVKVAPQMSE